MLTNEKNLKAMKGKGTTMREELEEVVITDEQAALVTEWLEANYKVPGWLDGHALGQSYIDSRVNGGRGITARRRYVSLDHRVASAVPELRGFRASDIREFVDERNQAAIPQAGNEAGFRA